MEEADPGDSGHRRSRHTALYRTGSSAKDARSIAANRCANAIRGGLGQVPRRSEYFRDPSEKDRRALSMENSAQLMYLLGYAYHMEWWRISEKPTSGSVSLGSVYEIEATTGPDTTEDQERLMLQTLLIERFKMVAHREIKDAVQGYALTVTKDGPRMEAVREEKASDDPTISDGWVSAHGSSQGAIAVEGRRAAMLQLTETLQRLLSTSVLDHTGLTGKYNFQVEFERGDDPSDYTAVVAAVRRLGLKLEKYKGPVEFLVIDHLDKLAEN